MTHDDRSMMSAEPFQQALSASQERRGYRRVNLSVPGRYMLEDRREFPCQTLDMSPGGVGLIAPVPGEIGSRVVVYLDHIGRLEGSVVRKLENGFAMRINAPQRKQDKLAGQLTWLASRQAFGVPENRRHERIELTNAQTVITLEDGRRIKATVIDCSVSGAALDCAETIPLGSELSVGRCEARVVRHFEGGIGVEFHQPIGIERFGPDLLL
jgi:c-di-GMP-binding flagellar brake protein YcgR